MPTEQIKKEEEKTVDIDSSGPDTEVEIKDDQEKELEKEAIVEPEKPVEEKQEASDEKQETKEEKPVEEKDDKKQELEQYSEGVQKRIAKLTKKWREAERQKEAAIDFAKGVQAEHSHLKSRYSQLEPNYVKALEHRVTAGLEAAKSKLEKAREAGDINAEVDAQKTIAQLGVEETRLMALKERQSQDKEKEVKTPSLQDTVAGKTPPPDPRAEAWAEKNEWFGKDSAMTYTAFDYHKKLTEQEGFDPNSEEYYKEIDKRMRIDFPHKFGNTVSQEPTKLTQTVASATRSVKPGRKSVRLTSSQVAIAKKLGVPLEEYAKQLKITKEA
jgi:hypothetical protein